FFSETYHQANLAKLKIVDIFVQDNHSLSAEKPLRGLHYQPHNPQAKLCRLIEAKLWMWPSTSASAPLTLENGPASTSPPENKTKFTFQRVSPTVFWPSQKPFNCFTNAVTITHQKTSAAFCGTTLLSTVHGTLPIRCSL